MRLCAAGMLLAGPLWVVGPPGVSRAGPGAGRPRASAGGPRASAGGPRASIGGPRASIGGPRASIGGPRLGGHGVIVDYAARDAPRLPAIAASGFVVADAGTGQVLAARDPHGWYRPASTLKVLTAVTFIPLLNPDATVVASRRAASTEAMAAGLVAGHRYRVGDLFTALLTISANDAAVALAQAVGSYARGIALMNAEARRLRALDTVAIDPNGLDAPGQHTSAYDLALFARRALALPAFMRYDETRTARFPLTSRTWETLDNQNRLLSQFPGGIGGKIGWTRAAGATYIGLARRHGVTLIATLMHCPALTEIASAERLLDWGFAADGKVRPVGTLVGPANLAAAWQPAGRGATPAPRAAAAGRAASARSAAGRHRGAFHAASIVAAVTFTGVAVLAVGWAFASTRRQRHAARSRPAPDSSAQG